MDEGGVVVGDRMALPAIADLVQAGPLKATIEQALVAGVGLKVDASGVQRINSPCLQVLVAGIAAFAKAGGPSLVIENPSAPFLEAVTTLGLADAMRLS